MSDEGSFIHVFIPSSKKSKLTLLLLHGTGGDENDLIPLGLDIAPIASILSPRGKVIENGMSRFFRRFPDGSFDIQDLRFRTEELSKFITWASQHYNFDLGKMIVLGYSNGANMALSVILTYRELIAGAILFRAVVPYIPDRLPDLSGMPIFLSEGMYDPYVSLAQAESLKILLEKLGASLTYNLEVSAHRLTQHEIRKAREFFQENFVQ